MLNKIYLFILGRPRLKTWLFRGVGIWLVWHLLLVTMYCLAGSVLPERVYYWSAHYVSPWFHQNWEVFAPEPPTQFHALVFRTVGTDGTYGPWHYPAYAQLLNHRNNRLSSASELFDIEEALAENLYRFTERREINSEKIDSSMLKSYPVIHHAFEYARAHTNDAERIEIGLLTCHLELSDNQDISWKYALQRFRIE